MYIAANMHISIPAVTLNGSAQFKASFKPGKENWNLITLTLMRSLCMPPVTLR